MIRRLFGRTEAEFSLSIDGTDQVAPVRRGQTILDAAIAADIRFPNMCAVGECGTCRCQVTAGQVKLKRDITHHISLDEIREGHVLACQSQALSELSVRVPGFGNSAVTTSAGRITHIDWLTHDIQRITVAVQQRVSYRPGQYASVSVPGVVSEPRHYSFASPCDGEASAELEFFIRHVPGGEFTDWLFASERLGAEVVVQGPFGDFYYRDSMRPILCFAGGSGLAPIKALLEGLADTANAPPVTLFFGAREQRDLYWQAQLQGLQQLWPAPFEYFPVLSAAPEDSTWQGLRGIIPQYLDQPGVPPLAECDAYLCGPPPMLDAIIGELEGVIPGERIHFDKFLDKSSLAAMTADSAA